MRSPPQRSRRAILATLLAACGAALGCRASPRPGPPAVPTRIVSLTPNTTETLFAIGEGERLVARSRYCDFPPEVKRLPSVGGYVDPSFEAILAARPELVIGARGPSGRTLVDRLEERGIRTWFPVTETIAEILHMVQGLADLIAVHDAGARVVDDIARRLARIDERLAGRKRPRVLLVFGLAPIVVAGPGGFPDEMLRRAGMINAVATGATYPTINVEAVLSIDPDLVIDAAMAEGGGQTRITGELPGWSAARAVREGRVVAVRDDSVLRPGPRVAEGVVRLASIAHPEVGGL